MTEAQSRGSGDPDGAEPPGRSPLPGDHTDPYLPWIDSTAPPPAGTSGPSEDFTDPDLVPVSVQDTDRPGLDPPEVDDPIDPTSAYDDVDWLAQPPAGEPPWEPPPGPRPWWLRGRVLVPVAVLAVLALAYGLDLLAAGTAVPRHTVVAGIDLGGQSREEAARILAERGVERVEATRQVTAGPVELTVRPAEAGFALDVPGTVDAAAAQPLNPVTRLLSLFTDRDIDAVLDVDTEALTGAMADYAADVDVTFVEGSIAITGTETSIVAPVDGRSLRQEEAAGMLQAALRRGSQDRLVFPVVEQQARISVEQAEQTLHEFVVPALSAPVTLTGSDGARTELTVDEIGSMLRFGPDDDGSLLAWVDPAALLAGMEPDVERFATPPVEASFDVTGPTVQVLPSADGARIDIAGLASDLQTVLLAAAPRDAAVRVVEATAALSTEQARALGIVEPVSTFTSAYAEGPAAQNIRLVAEAVDRAVVRPGESFSLNTAIGPRTAAEGYVVATAPGEPGPAVGEGVSPFATAMFNSVFFAGLEEVGHSPHATYHADYPAGRDATLRGQDVDLVWRNDSPYGIFVQTRWTPTTVSVTFWGTRVVDIEAVSGTQSHLVRPPSQTRSGPTCRTSSGSTGFDIIITRVFRQAGTSQRLADDAFATSYAPSPRVLCLGETAPPPIVEPPPLEPPVTFDPPPLPAPPGEPTQTSSRPSATSNPPPVTTAPTTSPPTTTTTTPPTTSPSTTTTTTPPTTSPPTTSPPATTTTPPPSDPTGTVGTSETPPPSPASSPASSPSSSGVAGPAGAARPG